MSETFLNGQILTADMLNNAFSNKLDASLGESMDLRLQTAETTLENIMQQVESADRLASLVTARNHTTLIKSYYNGLNIGGGVFTLIDTAQAVDNGIVFASQDAGKKWVRAEQTYLTPDMFGAKPNNPSFDSTDALNRAFATGRVIYGKKDDVYYVNGILKTKGQQLVGGWKISTSRYNLGVVSTEVEPVDNASIRMLYLESAYDLSELLYIKSLGFNTINHYGYFANNGAIDASGTLSQLLDNAKTAGLQVNLGTENDEAKANLANYVKKYDSHPSVWGYSVYDEPATRGFTVAQQDDKIAQLRALTTKKLTFVDLVVDNSPFQQKFSQKYDIAFVNSYALKRTSGTFDEKVSLDLDSMRRNYGFIKGMTKLSRIIPVIGSYLDNGTTYTNEEDRVIATAEVYATIDEGNFGAFVWDGMGDPSIMGNVRNNQKIKDMIKRITAQRTRKKINTDVYLFGGGGAENNWGLNDIIGRIVKADPFTTDDKLNLNSYPVSLKNGTTETDRTSASVPSGQQFDGFGFKGDWAAITTDIKYRKNTLATLRFRNFGDVTNASFVFFRTSDGGYACTLQYSDTATSDGKSFEFVTRSPNPNDSIAILLINQGDTTTKYRKLLYGAIICTDW